MLQGLPDLEAQVRRDREYYSYYAQPWVISREAPDGQAALDVAIVGAGQNGLGVAYGLSLQGITRVKVFDQNPKDAEGNFHAYRRMHHLRTPKALVGMDFGNPNLTFRRYCEARFGSEYWEGFSTPPREAWNDYLHWFRHTLGIDVVNECRLTRIEPVAEDLFELSFSGAASPGAVFARCVVLATGSSSDTRRNFPDTLRLEASLERWAHGGDVIDFARLRGKRVAILGHGAGAFDAAGTALDHGAARVDLCFRRERIPLVNPRRHMEYAGMMGSYAQAAPECRWRLAHHLAAVDQPPPNPAWQRVKDDPRLFLHPGTTWESLNDSGQGVRVLTPRGAIEAEFAILATGFIRAPLERPEIESFVDAIATWGDFEPPEGKESDRLRAYPKMGEHFEFLPKTPGKAEFVRRIFSFSFGVGLDLGPHVVSISGMQFSQPKVVEGIRDRLFADDASRYLQAAIDYQEPELALSDADAQRLNLSPIEP